jgi:hypothetical protein
VNLEIEEYISGMDPEVQKILYRTRNLILASAPFVREQLKYRVPFYEYKWPLCYLNVQKKTVYLGFPKGVWLSNERGILEGDGKQVRKIILEEHYPLEELIMETLQEAILLNETH